MVRATVLRSNTKGLVSGRTMLGGGIACREQGLEKRPRQGHAPGARVTVRGPFVVRNATYGGRPAARRVVQYRVGALPGLTVVGAAHRAAIHDKHVPHVAHEGAVGVAADQNLRVHGSDSGACSCSSEASGEIPASSFPGAA